MEGFAAKFSSKAGGGDFVSKVIHDRTYILDLRATQKGQKVYFILRVDKKKYEDFRQLWEQKAAMNLEDYGTVLHKGAGEPPESLKAELSEKYGLYED